MEELLRKIAELEEENKKLREEAKYNERKIASAEQRYELEYGRHEIYRLNGIIEGLKYALDQNKRGKKK